MGTATSFPRDHVPQKRCQPNLQQSPAPLVALAVRAPLPVVLGACVLTGVLLDVSIIAWATVVQQHLAGRSLARLTALNSVGEQAAIPLAYLAVALSAGRIDASALLWCCAVMIIAATAANLAVPAVHRVHRLS